MTNVQISTTLENFSNLETREEIHLTELLPVKKSAIAQNPDDNDDAVADAFKALREGNKHFSLNRNEFNLNKNNDDYHQMIINDTKKENFNEDYEIDGINKKRITNSNRVFKKRIKHMNDREKSQRNYKEKLRQNQIGKNIGSHDSFENLNLCAKNDSNIELCDSDDENKVSSISQDKNHQLVDKNTIFSDEIYVFRQENRTKDLLRKMNKSKKNLSSKVEKSSNSNERLKDLKIDSNMTKEMNKNQKINEKFKNKEEKLESNIRNEDCLREKIDAIIQANYVMERKNNNCTMRENRNKLITEESSETEIRNSGGEEEEEESSLEKKHRCAICNAKFKGSGGLRTHYKVVHAAGPMFTCNECGKEFPLKERLKLHVRTHTGYKPYKCNECDKSFARGGQLVQHRRTHTQVKPYRCVICPGTFSCAANLALHVKRHNGQKDHKCDICGRAFVRRDALKKHLECLHKDVKSFLCVICNKTFKGHLPQHMRTHAQDRPHGCATCGQRFAQKSQLTVHQRTHSGQRPFRCLVCWQAFAHSTALKLHTRRHTGERPFKCAECNAGFTQLPHWKKHMRCVHGRTDPYCCKNCNTFFRIKNDLETHEKNCHLAEARLDIDGESRMGRSVIPKYRIMTVEKMRLLLAVLFKRISKPERLDELGFGKRLIDEVLKDSLLSAGKEPADSVDDGNEFDILKQNLATFLEWTVPKEHWEAFKKLNKSPEEILETLTVSQ